MKHQSSHRSSCFIPRTPAGGDIIIFVVVVLVVTKYSWAVRIFENTFLKALKIVCIVSIASKPVQVQVMFK